MAKIILLFVVNLANSLLLAANHASSRKILANFSKLTVLLFKTDNLIIRALAVLSPLSYAEVSVAHLIRRG